MLRISERGRRAIVSLAAATKAIEAETMLALKPTGFLRLKQLLVRLAGLFGAAPGMPVFGHMDVLGSNFAKLAHMVLPTNRLPKVNI